MTTRLVPTTRKPQVVWAVLSVDVTDRVVHATGLSRADALTWFKKAYGYEAQYEKRAFMVRRIRGQEVEPAKKPAMIGSMK